MNDTANSPAPNAGPGRSCRRGRGPRVALVALFAVGAGFFAGKAMSHGFGPMGSHFGPHSAITRVFLPANVDDATDRAGRAARHLAIEVNATYEQEQKLVAIAKGVAADVYGLRREMKDARDKGLTLMKAPAVDRTAVEAFRTEQMGRLDAISKRLSTALADASEVLSAEQRVRLVDRIEDFRAGRWWKRWHRE